MATITFTETTSGPVFLTRMRRLSKSNFTYESESKSPRLSKMIAHVNLFDKTTKCLEEELSQKAAQPSAEKVVQKAIRPRPRARRADEYQHKPEDIPAWVTDLTSRPAQQDCIVVTEVEHAEESDMSP